MNRCSRPLKPPPVVAVAEPVWICGRCSRRLPRPETGAGRTVACKCGARRSNATVLKTSVGGASWHRPTN